MYRELFITRGHLYIAMKTLKMSVQKHSALHVSYMYINESPKVHTMTVVYCILYTVYSGHVETVFLQQLLRRNLLHYY